jgi:hypothetical protein
MLFSWSAVPEGIAREGNAELPRVWCNPEIKIALIRVSEVLDQGPRAAAAPLFFPPLDAWSGIVLSGSGDSDGHSRVRG